MDFCVNPLVSDIPRVGAEIVLPSVFENFEYFGLGPMENYRDRKQCAYKAVFNDTVTNQHFPYEPPSECGGHEGTRWIKFKDDEMREIKFYSHIPFHFDARHHSISDYKKAGHDYELHTEKASNTILHIDCAHAGIGGDMGWSTFLDLKDRVNSGNYSLSFIVCI